MVRSLNAVAVLAALLLSLYVVASCGGGDEELTPEQYFQRLEGVLNDGRQGFEAADNAIEEGLEREESVEEARDAFAELAKVYREMRDDLHDLDAPAEARAAQGEMAAPLAHFAQALEDAQGRAEAVNSQDELRELTSEVFGGEEAEKTFDRVRNGCEQLQDMAVQQGVEVDMKCGRAIGGEPLSMEEYFERLGAIFERARNQTDAVAKQLDQEGQAAKTLEERKAAVNRFLDGTGVLFQEAISGMEELNPPEAPSSSHEMFLDAAGELVGLTKEFQERLASVSTDEEAKSVVTEFDDNTREAIKRGDGACRELQATAVNNGIVVDLQCDE